MNVRNTDKETNDLFNEYHAVDAKIGRKTRFLLPDIRNTVELSYENIVLLAIGFVMLSIILFSLGVEKGRYDMLYIMKQKAQYNQNKKTGGISNVAASEPKNVKSR